MMTPNSKLAADFTPPTGPQQFERAQSFAGDGLIVVDKPLGMTSHDVDFRLRRLAGTRKVGHAGTLDPNASGVLVLGIGKGTKLLQWAQASQKTYRARLVFGIATNTEDAAGFITEAPGASTLWSLLQAEAPARPASSVNNLSADFAAQFDGTESSAPALEVSAGLPAELPTDTQTVVELPLAAVSSWLEQLFSQFTGKIQQVPSSFSALKVQGKRAYDLARKGEAVALEPRPVEIYRLQAKSALVFRWVKPSELLVPAPPRGRDSVSAGDVGTDHRVPQDLTISNTDVDNLAAVVPTAGNIDAAAAHSCLPQKHSEQPVLVAELEIEVACSAGTYIRALARDLGRAIGCPAHLGALRRVAAGRFDLDSAYSLAQLAQMFIEEERVPLLPLSEACRLLFPSVQFNAEMAYRISVGQKPEVMAADPSAVAAGMNERESANPQTVASVTAPNEVTVAAPVDQPDQLYAVFCSDQLIALARRGRKYWSPQLVFQPAWHTDDRNA